MDLVKKIKLEAPNLLITGQKAEQFEPIKRPQTSHDLNIRVSPEKRSITARSTRK